MKIVNNHGNIAISDNCERFHSPRIKPPRIANRDKFPEIRNEDCDSCRVIRGKYFSLN